MKVNEVAINSVNTAEEIDMNNVTVFTAVLRSVSSLSKLWDFVR